MTLPMMSVGAKGVISVISNIVPGKMVEMTSATLRGDFQTAREIHAELFPLMRLLMKTETNPSPIKAAMNIAGMNIGSVRLPLSEPDDEGKALIKKQLKLLGIING